MAINESVTNVTSLILAIAVQALIMCVIFI